MWLPIRSFRPPRGEFRSAVERRGDGVEQLVAVAVGTVVGTTLFGWEFGGSDPVPILLGVVSALVAVAVTASDRYG
ncbi:MAG: multidrug transporter [Halobaculum sp.]